MSDTYNSFFSTYINDSMKFQIPVMHFIPNRSKVDMQEINM
jgi:hypothetical protein